MAYRIKFLLLIILSTATLDLSACGAAPPTVATTPIGHLDYPSILNVTAPLEEGTDIKSSLMSMIGVKVGKLYPGPITAPPQGASVASLI